MKRKSTSIKLHQCALACVWTMNMLCLLIVGCTTINDPDGVLSRSNVVSIESLVIPDDFNFESEQEQVIEISSLDNQNKVLGGVPFSISYWNHGEPTKVISLVTNENGKARYPHKVPNHIDSLLIESHYIGVSNRVVASVPGVQQITLGGKATYKRTGRIETSNTLNSAARVLSSDYHFMDDYDNNGVPYNLEPIDDHIFQDMLDLINTSLPERAPVPTNNPQYLADDLLADTHLSDSADLWITFVHEGAGWRNALGYYTYDMTNPPASKDDIDSLKVIFPNASFLHGGGGLVSGNKIHLGKFPPNTGIGWFLVPNGWNGSGVAYKSDIKFSNKAFNTFTSEQYRQHVVLLKDEVRELILLGMEDISRPSGDNDFNDAVFYITANPFSAIITDQLETTQSTGPDQDGDGIADANDAYPNDPDKAFDIFTPSQGEFGSLAFEDLWPQKGDYDMNDMVINYNYKFIANAALEIKEIQAQFKLRALGATIHSGFGIEMTIPPSLVDSVTGIDVLPTDEVILDANGTESGQDNMVIILFEDGFRVWNNVDHINTKEGDAYIDPIEFSVNIYLNELYPITSIGYAPFNAFIFDSEDRSKEIHLSTGTPTSKMDLTLLGSAEDNSSGSKYFVTSNNLPWAFSLPAEFDYPKEFIPINEAFLKFSEWAQTGGRQYDDWYTSKTGYRQTSKVYTR